MAETFDDLLVETLPKLRGYAVALSNDWALADDLLQETALRALAARTQFTMGTNFQAWLCKILRNEFLGCMRRSHRRGVPLDNLPDEFVSRAATQDEQVLVRELGRALVKLPRSQREALILICASGLSYDESAEVMGCTVGTVKSRVFRARAQMEAFVMGKPEDEAVAPSTAKPRAAPVITPRLLDQSVVRMPALRAGAISATRPFTSAAA